VAKIIKSKKRNKNRLLGHIYGLRKA